MSTEVSFGRWVQRRRRGLGLTTSELAARCALSVHTLRKIEIDERRPSRQVAALLAEALLLPAAERETFIHAARGERLVEILGDPARDEARPRPPFPRLPEVLIGRERDLAELRQWLTDELPPVVTIAGLGGIGKTQLAIAAARDVAGHFPDGCAFVPLAGADAGEFVPQQLARALGLALSERATPREQIAQALRSQQLLLVLDNAEQLLGEAGDETLLATIAAIREAAPLVKLLITSREPTRIAGEWVFGLRGLTLPTEGGDLAQSGAATLFIRQASRARRGFVPSPDDAAAIAEICRATAGLPLALELAAAWAHVLSPREIAEQLRLDITLLESQRRDLPPRQRSVRATFAYSWGLLGPDEQQALAHLSIFRNGCSPEAAAAVAGASLRALANLIDTSLLRRDDGPHGQTRFDMHELVRQFAAERLHQDPATETATRDRHAVYFLDMLSARERDLYSHGQFDALDALKPEIDNLRAAWDWAIARTRFDLLERASQAAYNLHQLLGSFREGRAQIQRVIDAIEQAIASGNRSRALRQALGWFLCNRGLMNHRLGNVGALAHDAERGLGLLDALGDSTVLVPALSIASIAPGLNGDLALARTRLERAHTLAAQLGDDLSLLVLEGQIGQNELQRGATSRAYARLRDAVARMRAIGDATFVGLLSTYLCQACFARDDPAEAQAVAEAHIPTLARLGDRYNLAALSAQVAIARLRQGDACGALDQARRVQAMSEEIAANEHALAALHVEGLALATLGELSAGKRALRVAIQRGVALGAAAFVLGPLCSLAKLSLDDDSRAPAWLALVRAHPATAPRVREQAGELLAQWSANTRHDPGATMPQPGTGDDLDAAVRLLEAGAEATCR